MTRDRAIALVFACIIAALLVRGDTIEGFGIGLLLGLVLGVLVGLAFAYGEPRPEESSEC